MPRSQTCTSHRKNEGMTFDKEYLRNTGMLGVAGMSFESLNPRKEQGRKGKDRKEDDTVKDTTFSTQITLPNSHLLHASCCYPVYPYCDARC